MKKSNRNLNYIFLLIMALFFAINSCKKDSSSSTVTDIDGNMYKIITIGSQTWMVENLRTTHYNDGTVIPNVNTIAWATLTTPAICTYNNTTNTDTINTYGRLYNWYTVNTEMLCPVGWHVPTESEWTTLLNYLGSDYFNWGGKLKETGTAHWFSPNTGATNEIGFTALPGGYNFKGNFYSIGYSGKWWSSTESSNDHAIMRGLSNGSPNIYGGADYKQYGYSVRCIKD